MSAMVQGALGPLEVTVVDSRLSPTVNDVDRERAWLALVPRAMGRAGLSHKALAADLDVDRAQLSRQLAGATNHHLSFRRMFRLPSAFWQELLPLIVEFHGLTLHDSPQQRSDAEIGRLVREAVVRSIGR